VTAETAVELKKIQQPAVDRNSISTVILTELDLLKVFPSIPMLLSSLMASLEPQNDPTQQCFYKMPPLLFPRKPKAETQG
jgi:hypothetical protein